MPIRVMPDDYLDHLENGGAPFGGKWDANIGEVVESYQYVVGRQRKTIRRLRQMLDASDELLADSIAPNQEDHGGD